LNPISISSDRGSADMLDQSRFIASASIASTDFDQVKTKNYSRFQSISEYDEEKFQMDAKYKGYSIPEDEYGSGLGALHQSGISKAHLITHAN
jgi:hypothetical protein